MQRDWAIPLNPGPMGKEKSSLKRKLHHIERKMPCQEIFACEFEVFPS
jgi:hypothetical protein